MKKPVEDKKHARFDMNGEEWIVSGAFAHYEGKLQIAAQLKNERLNSVEYSLTFYKVRKTLDRQFFGEHLQNQDTISLNWERMSGDQPIFLYRNIVGDTTNNYIQIVHQEDDYTKNMRVIFSADVVGGFANADTIRIRNGVIDFAKEF